MGGAEYQCKILCDRLKRDPGFEVHWVSRRAAPGYVPEHYLLHTVGSARRLAARAYFLDWRSLWRALDEIRPDVIYQRNGCGYTGIAAQWARSRGSRLVWNVAADGEVSPRAWALRDLRKPLAFLDRRVMLRGVDLADEVVAQTHFQREQLERHHKRSGVHVIQNFHPFPTEPQDKDPSTPTVLWIANFKRSKQPELFIKLAGQLSETSARFVMIGQPTGDEPWMAELLAAMATIPTVSYVGLKEQDEVNRMLAKAHVLISTSTQEGFSNTFVQAWMRAVPVVSLNADPDGLLQQGGLGACANGDWDAFVAAARRAIVDADWRGASGARARDYARESHSVRNIERLVALLSAPEPVAH